MPIKDLKGTARIPRLGKIHLGERKLSEKTGKEYPVAVDYFVTPPEIKAIYGEKPKRLFIMFHSDEIEEIFPQYYKRYGSSTGLVCKGDGEIANAVNSQTGEFEEVNCNGLACEFYKESKCKRIGNLYFMVRGVNRFGVYQLDTSSVNSILNVNGSIEYIKKITGDKLAGVPLILDVKSQEVTPGGKKKNVYVLQLEADISSMKKALESKPIDLFLEAPKVNEKYNIEEDLHPEQNVVNTKLRSIKEWQKITGTPNTELNKMVFKEFEIDNVTKLNVEQLIKFEEILTERLNQNIEEAETIKQETLT